MRAWIMLVFALSLSTSAAAAPLRSWMDPYAKVQFSVPSDIKLKAVASELPAEGIKPPKKPDSDFDGLSDADEALLGTDPEDPDTDGDALRDGWEVHGVNGVKLRELGASPLHKDVFVEMDYMVRPSAANGLGPNEAVLRAIAEAFADLPVENPDKKPGIALHLLVDQEVPHDENLKPLRKEFGALKKKYFKEARALAFHYMIWADAYDDSDSSGNSMDIPHSDFVVTLGRWNDGAGGTDSEKIGTFLHELGHNLGLHHGGDDDVGYKPNHLSVMNYLFQLDGVQRSGRRHYTYQRFALGRLDENELAEADGMGRVSVLADWHTRFFDANGDIREAPAFAPIDWTLDALTSPSVVKADLNGSHSFEALEGTSNECLRLNFQGGNIGSVAELQGMVMKSTLTFELAKKLRGVTKK